MWLLRVTFVAQVDLLSAQVTTLTGQTMELQDELQQLQQDAALAEQLQADLTAAQEEAQQVGLPDASTPSSCWVSAQCTGGVLSKYSMLNMLASSPTRV
jgi:exonuclease VII small subunit